MKRFVLFFFLLAACGSGTSDTTPKSKHVLVVGVDGVRPDSLMKAETPNLDGLIFDGAVSYDAFAGGEPGKPTSQPTFSGPGWSSILTGVWVDKHGVQLNVFDDANFDEYPHFFARIREKKLDAFLSSFVTWAPINQSILASATADAVFTWDDPADSAGGDLAVTAAVVAHLSAETPDVVFVHLDEVDHQGHAVGYGPDIPRYVEAIETVDAQIGEMLDAIRARSTYASENWLVIATTDHGGIGQGHGGQTEEERTVFLIASGRDAEPALEGTPAPGLTAVPPTVMRHLGLSVDPAWGWESEPFGL